MKSIKEKQMLVKWAKAMNEPIDQSIVEEVERYDQLQKEIIESVRTNSIKDLAEASVVSEQLLEKINIKFPKPPTLDEVLEALKEETNELVQSQPVEEPTQTEQPVTLADRAAEHIANDVKLEQASFQQPSPPPVDRNLEAIQKKLKFLEQAIGKIAATGPGGGEVNLRWLDDVNRDTIQDGYYLKYVAANSKFEFSAVSGSGTETDTLDTVTTRGNTTDNGIEVANVIADYFQLRTGLDLTPTEAGQFVWDDNEQTAFLGLANNNLIKLGQEILIRVKCDDLGGVSRGDAIMFAGVTGEHILVKKYDPTVEGFIPDWFVGVSKTTMAHNDFGYAIIVGEIDGLNITYDEGTILYADNETPGGLTPTEPNTSENAGPKIQVAAVTKKSSGDGQLQVRVTIRPRLRDLTEVDFITEPVTDQLLVYDGSISRWINKSSLTTLSANVIRSSLVQPTTGTLLLKSNIGGSDSGAYLTLSGAANGITSLVADGTGPITLTTDFTQLGKTGDATLSTNAGDIIINTRGGVNSGTIRIYDQANGNILLDPNGSGIVLVDGGLQLTGNVVSNFSVDGTITSSGDINGYAFNGRIGSVTGTTINADYYPIIVSAISPDQYLEGHLGLKYNPSSGTLTANVFAGAATSANSAGFVTGYGRAFYRKNEIVSPFIASGTNYVIPWDNQDAFNISDFTHGSGVFTNTSTRTRRFNFQMTVAITATGSGYTETDIWFALNGTVGGTNRRGQIAYNGGASTNQLLSTSWTFTLAQNDTVRCYVWANDTYKIGHAVFGMGANNSCILEITEV